MKPVRKPAVRGVQSAVSAIRRYADSFIGQTIEQVQGKLSRAKTRALKWKHGKEIVATFPKYELRLFFYKDSVVTTSVQILSSI